MLGFVCYMLIILYKIYLCLYEWVMSDILEKVSLFIYVYMGVVRSGLDWG